MIEEPEHLMLAANGGDFTYDENMWMIYTSASNHMTPHEKFFTNLDRTYRARVRLADGTYIMAQGKGDVKVMTEERKWTIKNVLFVPGINRNVLCAGQMTERGYSIIMGGDECVIRDETGEFLAESIWQERGFALRFQVIESNLTS